MNNSDITTEQLGRLYRAGYGAFIFLAVLGGILNALVLFYYRNEEIALWSVWLWLSGLLAFMILLVKAGYFKSRSAHRSSNGAMEWLLRSAISATILILVMTLILHESIERSLFVGLLAGVAAGLGMWALFGRRTH